MKLRKVFGVTAPFNMPDGNQFYAKTLNEIEVETDEPILPQIEAAVKMSNLLDDVMVKFTDTQLRRQQLEYMGEVPDDGPTSIDVPEFMKEVKNIAKSHGIK